MPHVRSWLPLKREDRTSVARFIDHGITAGPHTDLRARLEHRNGEISMIISALALQTGGGEARIAHASSRSTRRRTNVVGRPEHPSLKRHSQREPQAPARKRSDRQSHSHSRLAVAAKPAVAVAPAVAPALAANLAVTVGRASGRRPTRDAHRSRAAAVTLRKLSQGATVPYKP